ncbi:hypothetical protein ABIF66_006874 [Bradyrhizobium japonicum]
MPVPVQPKIYHIVHVDNLASIVADGFLWSDSVMVKRQGATVIGMGSIKQRRLGLPIACHHGLQVGDCVPFYFCPRSIMLYVIHCANHPELTYRGASSRLFILKLISMRLLSGRKQMVSGGRFQRSTRRTEPPISMAGSMISAKSIGTPSARDSGQDVGIKSRPSFFFNNPFLGNWFVGSAFTRWASPSARRMRCKVQPIGPRSK